MMDHLATLVKLKAFQGGPVAVIHGVMGPLMNGLYTWVSGVITPISVEL